MTVEQQQPENYHQFTHPVKRVALIGSGPSGTPAARHLRDAGLEVRVFERQSQAGGIWNWRPAISLPLGVPTPPPSRGAFTPEIRESGVVEDPDRQLRERFSPPNPCYWNLSNNVPTNTMAFKDFPYPPGTNPNVSHELISTYVHDYAKSFGLDKLTSYDTRVELAEKTGDTWKLTLRKVVDEGEEKAREEFWTEEFDAVVVATGHYNAPYIPYLEGADTWSAAWPEKLIHSQGYRKPEPYADKTVLIVGIGTSGNDIGKDLAHHAKKIFLVGRNTIRGPQAYQEMRRMQRHLKPDNSEQVPEIQRFLPPVPGQSISEGRIELTDGRVLSGIDEIIFATGYQYSFPFLPRYHQDLITSSPAAASVTPVVTNGDGVLNLYRDVFYIPDPTLTFLGLSVNTSAFSFFEYQSLSIARVLSGKARLPDEPSRWRAYRELVAKKGEGKFSHFMGKEGERSYVRETVEWLNRDAAWSGAEEVEGHTETWLAESDKIPILLAAKYGLSLETLKEIKEDIAGVPKDGSEGSEFQTAVEETNARASEGKARLTAAATAAATA